MGNTLSNYPDSLDSTTPIPMCQEPISHPTFAPQTETIRHCEIGSLMLSTGRYQEALGQFEQALALQPHAIAGWCGRAETLACLNRYEDALSSVEQAQELSSVADAQIWLQKAVILIFLQRYDEALSCCGLILQRHPEHIQALLFQGVARHRLGQHRKAYRSYCRVKALTTPRRSRKFRRSGHERKSHRSAC
jgi:tetratricopeptide (TPR) repeat protein